MSKTWFITGAGRGLGREYLAAALSRGDRVAATARDTGALEEFTERYGDAFLPLTLDVTDRTQAFATVEQAVQTFGRLDVVVNNAGYPLYGAVEEISPQQLRDQFETNVIGLLNVTQAALPVLRAQSAGHLIQISSIYGVVSLPLLGGYQATKWATEGLTEALAAEVGGMGIKVTLVELGAYKTGFNTESAVWGETMPAYQPVKDEFFATVPSLPVGDPAGVGPAMLKIVDAEVPPLRVLFGALGPQVTKAAYAERLAEWSDWEHLAIEAMG
ncbi:SDR family NAD(P)-dependent oxidoreductase [Actinoplanes sp. TBRC 11911]|uniref:SDR family NAD(P)-dependent oxidoreductase n=1 Tax=Actinoplanes sp. TBRC 11911 TaxID=2729386 RepID=UPI00145C476D|nr:SDR family NAD(P)-dependent oxidoreductase [Actinoplanes sp. TBRC 11911]NMO55387.1 SDR family NAD(P)-dependent oxidoreductase [Actinoplanes sp. TBRC 11911]